MPKLFDEVTTRPTLLTYVLSNLEKSSGGTQTKVPIKTSNDTQGGSYDVNATFTTNMPNTRNEFVFDWTLHQQPVVVANPYIAMSSGKEQILDYLRQATDEAWIDFQEMISNQLVGAGSGTDMLGLQALIDDGTRVATYGGITRSGNTFAQGNYTASVGTLAAEDMQDAYRAAERLNMAPNMIWTHTAVRDAYEDLVLPTLVSNVNTNMVSPRKPTEGKGMDLFLNYGSASLAYKGVPIWTDNHIASDEMYFWHSDNMKFHMLPNKVYPGNKEFGVSFRDFAAPIDQDAQVAYYHLYGQWINKVPQASSCLDGITT
jgi:hypothetical protein